MSQAVADVLERAAEILDRDGWQKGPGGHIDGPCCVMYAVVRAVRVLGWTGQGVYLAADRALRTQVGGRARMTAWNDRKVRTEADVLAALRGAAAREREAQS